MIKEMFTGIVMAGTVLFGSLTGGSHAGDEPKPEKKYETHLFMLQSETKDGFYMGAPIEAGVDGGYVFEKKKNYHLGDIISATYWNDDCKEEHKVEGKKLVRVENKYGSAINALQEEGIQEDWNK